MKDQNIKIALGLFRGQAKSLGMLDEDHINEVNEAALEELGLMKAEISRLNHELSIWTTITPSGYVHQAMRTAQKDKLTPKERILNASLGLGGESGEFIDHIKKHVFHGHDLDKDYLLKELGDILWYVALAADTLETPLETIMENNINKLRKRYPGEGFESEKSINRTEEGSHA